MKSLLLRKNVVLVFAILLYVGSIRQGCHAMIHSTPSDDSLLGRRLSYFKSIIAPDDFVNSSIDVISDNTSTNSTEEEQQKWGNWAFSLIEKAHYKFASLAEVINRVNELQQQELDKLQASCAVDLNYYYSVLSTHLTNLRFLLRATVANRYPQFNQLLADESSPDGSIPMTQDDYETQKRAIEAEFQKSIDDAVKERNYQLSIVQPEYLVSQKQYQDATANLEQVANSYFGGFGANSTEINMAIRDYETAIANAKVTYLATLTAAAVNHQVEVDLAQRMYEQKVATAKMWLDSAANTDMDWYIRKVQQYHASFMQSRETAHVLEQQSLKTIGNNYYRYFSIIRNHFNKTPENLTTSLPRYMTRPRYQQFLTYLNITDFLYQAPDDCNTDAVFSEAMRAEDDYLTREELRKYLVKVGECTVIKAHAHWESIIDHSQDVFSHIIPLEQELSPAEYAKFSSMMNGAGIGSSSSGNTAATSTSSSSRAEFSRGVPIMNLASTDVSPQIYTGDFAKIDTDGDGGISWGELYNFEKNSENQEVAFVKKYFLALEQAVDALFSQYAVVNASKVNEDEYYDLVGAAASQINS